MSILRPRDTRRVKAPYRSEIDALAVTYAVALEADVSELRRAVHALGRGPALFIGSGGIHGAR